MPISIINMGNEKISLKQFAELNNISYKTAHRHWKQGNIDGMQLPTGTILVKGWNDKSNKKLHNESKYCTIMLRSKNSDTMEQDLAALNKIAKDKKLIVVETIIWDGYIFQENPFIEHIMLTETPYVLTNNASEIYGINHKSINLMLRKMGIETIQSNHKETNITNMVYNSVSASSSMARSAVGMSNYKKAIAQANKDLLS